VVEGTVVMYVFFFFLGVSVQILHDMYAYIHMYTHVPIHIYAYERIRCRLFKVCVHL